MDFCLQRMEFLPKMEFFTKNGIFCQKWNFLPKMEFFTKNGIFKNINFHKNRFFYQAEIRLAHEATVFKALIIRPEVIPEVAPRCSFDRLRNTKMKRKAETLSDSLTALL